MFCVIRAAYVARQNDFSSQLKLTNL